MATPTYLSLSSSGGPLTDPTDVVPSILRHMFATPAFGSDYFEGAGFNNKLSFRRLMAQHGDNPTAFCNMYSDALTDVLVRYFPNRKVKVDTWYQLINENTGQLEDPTDDNGFLPRYTVFLDVHVANEKGVLCPAIISQKVEIDSDKSIFTIKFGGNV